MAKIKFDNKANVTQDLPVKPIKEYKDLVVGEIISVELTEKVSEAKTNYQYAGHSIPNLVIKFKQKIDKWNNDTRISTWVFKPIVSIKNDGTNTAEDTFVNLVMGQFSHLKHILDAYEGIANFKALGKIPDIDSELETEKLLAAFKAFYASFATAFEGKDGKGVYNGVEVAVKFIVNKGEKRLHIPNFVNRGYIQLAKFDKLGKIVTNLAFYGETIEIPTVVAGNVAPGMNGAPIADTQVDLTTI
jgi:hypothetical protein